MIFSKLKNIVIRILFIILMGMSLLTLLNEQKNLIT